MIWHDVDQRTQEPEWKALRCGIPTASEFQKILTPKKLTLSSQHTGYMYRLLAEWITGEAIENPRTEYMDIGVEREDEAVRAYEGLMDVETERGGFFTTDDGLIGCTPDRLVGADGDLEIKAPAIQTQVGYALDGMLDDDYRLQIQGRMWIHGRKWVDIFSYHPAIIIPPVRVPRDEECIRVLAMTVCQFRDIMVQKRLELEQRYGPFVRTGTWEPEADHTRDWITEADLAAQLELNARRSKA